MAFLEDPRLRQRWNQIAHDAETVTENAAAGIWSFQQHYIGPCLGAVADSIEQCTAPCLGDREERRWRRRERERAAEYSFDFYDDWYEEDGSGGLLGGWGGDDWDRLLAGTGSQRRHGGGETGEQPRRKRGMSYGTRGPRRRTGEQDLTIIPSTQLLGFLSKMPWKLGGTLQYRPSAADLQDRPARHDDAGADAEAQPLLGAGAAGDDGGGRGRGPRQRSGTTGSGDTSDSYRSRGDLFPSDGEGDEDAVPLDGEMMYDMVRKEDCSSRTRSTKGKRSARTVSQSQPPTPDAEDAPSLKDLALEEERLRREDEVARNKGVARQLAAARGLDAPEPKPGEGTPEPPGEPPIETAFRAARLPRFG